MKPRKPNKTRGGTALENPLPVTAGHCLPATPARLSLLVPDTRPHRATLGRADMSQTNLLTSNPGKGAPVTILAGWISRSDLARELGLTEDTLRRWEDRRIGPVCVRAGRRVYYRRTAVQDWLAAQEAAKQAHRRGHR